MRTMLSAASGLAVMANFSWLSQFETSVANLFKGKAAGSAPIIKNATTPVEVAVNQVGATAEQVAAPIIETVASGADDAVQGFLTDHVGAVGTELIDASLQALAAAALSKLSTTNSTTQEIAGTVSSIVTAITTPVAASPAASTPAPVSDPEPETPPAT